MKEQLFETRKTTEYLDNLLLEGIRVQYREYVSHILIPFQTISEREEWRRKYSDYLLVGNALIHAIEGQN